MKNRIVVIEKSTNKNRTFVLFSCLHLYTFKKMCRMNVIKTSDWPVLIQELIDEKDVVLTIHLDNFSLDELDDFDNLDSDESNNAD